MKVNSLWIILDLIFLAVFNAVFFVAGGLEHGASVWISYCFIHFAYFVLILTPFLIRKGRSSAVFGFSLYAVSSVYFLAELIIGVIFILAAPEGYKAVFLIQLTAAGFYGVLLIANMIADENTGKAEETRQWQISYVKNASAKLKYILDNTDDKIIKKA